MSRSVWISREVAEHSSLAQGLRSGGFELIAIPMIDTEGIPFDPVLPPSDWIFFSSSNAVRYFFEGNPKYGSRKIAALGQGTATTLSKYSTVDFMGDSTDPQQTAREFARYAGSGSVLFPVAEQSLRSIQAALPAAQVTNIVCYRTMEKPVEIGFPDVLVFSSPSNVRAFFRQNRIMDYQHIIAFGPSTAEALRSCGMEKVAIPVSLDDAGLLRAINEVSGS